MGPNYFFFDIREHFEKLIFEILRNDGRMLLRECVIKIERKIERENNTE